MNLAATREETNGKDFTTTLVSAAGSPADLFEWPTAHLERYELRRMHGRGGMGLVFEAWDRYLQRSVAIKKPLRSDPQSKARLIREALITARLQHPSIITVYEVGLCLNDPFYVMKFIAGQTMQERIASRGAKRLELLPHLASATKAVAYAHSQGIVHRDLKPSNILISDFGETMVLDWGIATDLSISDATREVSHPYQLVAASLTEGGAVIGTPQYMSREQAEGYPVDERMDIYGLGAILYHLLAGAPPYSGSSSKEVLKKVACESPPALDSERLGIPPGLVAVANKAMSRHPSQRYASALDFARDLNRSLERRIIH